MNSERLKVLLSQGKRSIAISFCLAMFITFWAARQAQSHDASAAPKYVTVPVMYATDRNRDGGSYGNHRRYPSNCQHQMYYGTAFITLENHEHISADKMTDALGWKLGDEKPKGKYDNDEVDSAFPLKARAAFFTRVGSSLDKAGSNQLCVYVHGAAEGFEDACEDAAELAYALRRPLILYSWPSEPKLLDYVVDNGNSEWSQGHFNLFCRDLYTFKQSHPLHLIMLAHSMGNRFLFRSMHFLYHSQLISDCEFISPDMDIDTCRHYLMGFRRIDDGTAMRLYVSNKDKMLKLSQKLFGGYARLGEDVQSHLVPNRAVESLTVLKDDHKMEKVASTPLSPAEADKASQLEQNLGKDEGLADVLERIDFTAMDKGFTGHSIPFRLIADLVDERTLASGFKLIQDKTAESHGHDKVVLPNQSEQQELQK
jgi:esterase/lipase superfamily enzyme